MLNEISLMGRITRDPVFRIGRSQEPMAPFTIAVERDDADDAYKTDEIDCIAFGGLAQYVCCRFEEGDLIAVSGRLRLNEWEDDSGELHTVPFVFVRCIYSCAPGLTDGAR